jgi:diaminopimelate epimerase
MTPATPDHPTLRLTKHHGAGNDFLVLIDREDDTPLGPEVVRALCDRRFGVGADGVIRVLDGGSGADLTMELTNADGGEAEMSGNGIRCLAQAAVEAGLVAAPEFTVMTGAGLRTVEYHAAGGTGAAVASVDMGGARIGPDQAVDPPVLRAGHVDMGNPHLVLLYPDPAGVDRAQVADVGQRLQAAHDGGVNVEFIAVGPGSDALTLRVWERGAGETRACGTGSAAAAAAAARWGLVGDVVEVHNPGGALQVTLTPDGVRLRGPVHKVADLTVVVGEILESAPA